METSCDIPQKEKNGVIYARKPIINIGREPLTRKPGIQEYYDRIITGKTEHNQQIIQSFGNLKIDVRQNTMGNNTHKKRTKNAPKEKHSRKYKVRNLITRILNMWRCRKLEHDAIELQEAAEPHNCIPIWKYRRALSENKKYDKNYMLHNADGALPKNIPEIQNRCTEWAAKCFQTTPEKTHTYNNAHR